MTVEESTAVAVTVAAAHLFDRAQNQLPDDVVVEALPDGIRVTGRRLFERAATDARLREIGR